MRSLIDSRSAGVCSLRSLMSSGLHDADERVGLDADRQSSCWSDAFAVEPDIEPADVDLHRGDTSLLDPAMRYVFPGRQARARLEPLRERHRHVEGIERAVVRMASGCHVPVAEELCI